MVREVGNGAPVVSVKEALQRWASEDLMLQLRLRACDYAGDESLARLNVVRTIAFGAALVSACVHYAEDEWLGSS